LLDASVASHERAVALDSRARTSVPHTWFMQADHARVATIKVEEFPYIVPLSLDALGRRDEALSTLRQLEQTTKTRLRDFIVAVRTLLEGHTADSLAAVNRIVTSDFRDPEGLFYLSRHLAHLKDTNTALTLFQRVVEGGFACFPMMLSDPWLGPLRKKPAFTKLLKLAETQHQSAAATFASLGGDKLLRH